MIIEENNVVVTEGVFGGIVEKIKALGRMIKGWLEKLIDFIITKFTGISRSKTKEPNINNNSKQQTEIENIQKNVDEIEKTTEKVEKQIEKIDRSIEIVYQYFDPYKNKLVSITDKEKENNKNNTLLKLKMDDIQDEIYNIRKEILRTSEEFSNIPNRIKEEKTKIIESNKKLNDIKNLKIKAPDLIDLDLVMPRILGECNYAVQQEDPNEYFKSLNKPVKYFFLKSDKELIMKTDEFQKHYNSYMDFISRPKVNNLKKLVNDIENLYKSLESEAARIDNNDEANKLLARSKNINKFLQTTMTEFVKCLNYYITKIVNLDKSFHTDAIVLRRQICTSKNKIEELEKKSDDILKSIKEKSIKIKKLKTELRSNYGAY